MSTKRKDNIRLDAPKVLDDRLAVFENGVTRPYNDIAEFIAKNPLKKALPIGLIFLVKSAVNPARAEIYCLDSSKNPYLMITTGLDAYDVALRNGFVGTEAEWLLFLQAPSIEAAAVALQSAQEADNARDAAITATGEAITATNEANTARDEALDAALTANAARGWSPEFGIESDGTIREVQKLIRWVGGTGYMPIDYVNQYVGIGGYVTDKAQAKNIKGKNAVINSSSVTSNVIGMGTKTFTLISPVDLVQGQVAKAYSLADPNNYICGYITNITLTSIEINVQEIGGIGTKTDWIIVLAAFQGKTGITTPNINSLKLAGRGTAGLGAVEELNPYGLFISGGSVYNGSYGVSEGFAIASINNPSGGLILDWGVAQTGALCIKIPSSATSTLLIKGSIFSTGANLSCSFIISAYPSAMGSSSTAIFIGGVSYPVRWYTDGLNRYIYIGDTTTVWGEKTIIFDNIHAALGNPFLFASGWVMSFETAFVGTLNATRLAANNLPKPGLQYPMEDYNAASGTETDVTNATSPIQAIQNIEKKLGNRYTKPQSDVRYLPTIAFNYNNGWFYKTSIAVSDTKMFQIELLIQDYSGNKLPEKIAITGYMNSNVEIRFVKSISTGEVATPIELFIKDGFLSFWINKAGSTTIVAKCTTPNNSIGENIITSLTNVVRPTGTTLDVTTTPVRTLLSSNISNGLTLVNDKLFNGVERYTDNTAQKLLLTRNIQDGLFRTGNATDVGAIKIALPAYGAGSQPIIKGLIYFYDALLATNRSCEFMITANTGSFGNGASAVFIGANAPKFPVRWYIDADGTTRYIAIGELTQDWSYLSFAITDVLNGFNGATLANTSSGYNISLITAFTGTLYQSRIETLPKPGLSNTALRGLTLQNDILYNGVEQGTGTLTVNSVNFPKGGMYKGAASETGAIRIKLPTSGAVQTMMTIHCSLYDFTNENGGSFIIKVYPSIMTRASVIFIGNTPYTVRWYTDGLNRYIYIGELATTWAYPSLVINRVETSYSTGLSLISDNWVISVETAFIGTLEVTKLPSQTLPNSNLNQIVSDFVAASGIDIPLTNAMSPLQMFQNLDKSRDNRYTKAQSLSASNPLSWYYNAPDGGLLINTDISVTASQSFIINIKQAVQSISVPPIEIEIQGVIAGGVLSQVTGLSKGSNFNPTDITILQINNKICVWFPTTPFRTVYATAYTRANSVVAISLDNKVTSFTPTTTTQPTQDVGSFTPQIVPLTNLVLTKNKPLNISTGGILGYGAMFEYIRYTANATLTIPTNATTQFPIGTRVDLTVLATFTLTIVASGGVTVNGLSNIVGYGAGYIRKVGTDEWDLIKY